MGYVRAQALLKDLSTCRENDLAYLRETISQAVSSRVSEEEVVQQAMYDALNPIDSDPLSLGVYIAYFGVWTYKPSIGLLHGRSVPGEWQRTVTRFRDPFSVVYDSA